MPVIRCGRSSAVASLLLAVASIGLLGACSGDDLVETNASGIEASSSAAAEDTAEDVNPTPSPTSTQTPEAAATPTVASEPTATSRTTQTPGVTSSATNTPTPSATAGPTADAATEPTATAGPSSTPTPKPTEPTPTPKPTEPTPTPKPTEPTPTPTPAPNQTPSAGTLAPTAVPNPSATTAATGTPRPATAATTAPTTSPTTRQTLPTATPTPQPTTAPTATSTVQPTATPSPTPTSLPARAPAAMGIALGGGIYDLSASEVDQRFAQLADAGVSWVRLDLNWAFLEPQPGVLRWSEPDSIVAAAQQNGLKVLGILAYTPSWARPAGTSDKYQPDAIEDFARFSGLAAQHFTGRIAHFEIWNEPNHLPFWASGPDPEFYGDMVASAAASIRTQQPSAFIISGGLSPAVDGSTSIAPETFMQQFLPRIPVGMIDAVGIHPYSFPALPTDQFSWNTFARLPQMRAIIAGHDPTLTLWPTEFGAPTNEVSQADQSAAIRRAVECSERYDWLGPMFIFTLKDLGGDAFGLLDTNGNPKSGWNTILDLGAGNVNPANCQL